MDTQKSLVCVCIPEFYMNKQKKKMYKLESKQKS